MMNSSKNKLPQQVLNSKRNRVLPVWMLLLALFGSQGSYDASAKDSESPSVWTPALMMEVKRVGSVVVSPDGKRVAYTVRQAVMNGDDSEYRTQIHLADVQRKESRQLTQGAKSCDDPQWSPDGKWIAFVSSRVGKRNLWAIDVDGGEAFQLTEMKSDIGSFRWSPKGDLIAFTTTDTEERASRQKNDAKVVDEDVKLNRLHIVSFSGPTNRPLSSRQLTAGTLSIVSEARAGRSGYDWSPDGTTIAAAHTTSPRPDDWPSADLSVINVADGTVKPILKTNAAETSPLFSPDGQQIACTISNDPPTWGGSRTVNLISVADGSTTKLAETYDGFGRYSELVGWSADGSQVFYTEVQGTSMKLLALPKKWGPVEIRRGPGMPMEGMSLGGVSLNSTRTHFGFGWERLEEPVEAFISAVAPFDPVVVSKAHKDLSMPPLPRTEVIRWKSSDGLEVVGLLTYPNDYKKGDKCPLLLVVHGGPMGVFTQTFDGSAGTYPIAAFASKGYAILRPNPRGSSGYGTTFRHANYNDWGGGDFRDVMTGVDHVIAEGIADPDRLGVMGWSYGGFMTSWAITQTKRFRAASVGAGVTNLMSFTGTADIPGFLPDYFQGEYWDKFDAYRNHSAMFQIKGVTTPTLIQHGERDERVPLSQGLELYNALKRQGCKTKMVIYPRTPHGIEEPRLMIDCMNRNLEWFDQYLVGSSRKSP
ncbi:MAG: S9 family peptidase [Schlesneria sp.]